MGAEALERALQGLGVAGESRHEVDGIDEYNIYIYNYMIIDVHDILIYTCIHISIIDVIANGDTV